jgi:hypothetical protein
MRLHSFVASAALFAAFIANGVLVSATVPSGTLIKGSLPAVYYVGSDGKRYVFPNDKTYFSWYQDFSQVVKVSDAELASYIIGGNATYRPGVRLVKIQSDPKVYAVAHGGVLRWIKTEAAAIALYGVDWNKQIDDISDSFFINYTVGSDIAVAADFDPAKEKESAGTIDESGRSGSNSSGNANANLPDAGSATACVPACTLGNACKANACAAVPGPSPLSVKYFVIDSIDTCFVGDACTGGSCCSIDGVEFADNANLKAVLPSSKYLYADRQQLCGRATLSSIDRRRVSDEFNAMTENVSSKTAARVNVSLAESRISGEFTMSRLPASCDWWVAPSDLRERYGSQIDSSVDAVFVASSKTFDFGIVSEPTSQTVDQSAGLGGAGYTYFVKEWEADTSGALDPSLMESSLSSQMSFSLDLGVSDPDKSYVGNHCRDGKRDFDETGTDCGGLGCNACAY